MSDKSFAISAEPGLTVLTGYKTTIRGDKQMKKEMTSLRKTSLSAGILYLLTFISIPTLSLYSQIHDPNYILGTGSDTAILFGCVLEIIMALACIGTAVALFPVLKRQNEGVALGFVGARVLEAGTIFAGVAFLLTVVTLHQTGAGADALVTSRTLVNMYDRIFFIGQSFIPAVNGFLLGSLLYRSRLVPRILPTIGIIGAVLLVAGDAGVLFGLVEKNAPATVLAGVPIAIWELSLGIWLVVKGFKPSAITSASPDLRDGARL